MAITTTRFANRRRVRLLVGVAGFALLGVAAPAMAQTAAEPASVGEVVVTGSRIRGVEAVGSNIIGLDRDEVIASGAPTTTDLLKKVPQIFGLGASETATSAQNGAANVTRGVGINLRGLGSNATLLLWNGRRFPAAGTQGQFTDPAVIPTLALERVEVVADGASAIYGSDAVAGVVNLILRKNFSGAESFARYGDADGYHDYSLGQVLGATWDGGNVMAAIEYTNHTDLKGVDRNFYTSDLLARGGSDFRANQCFPGNVVLGTTFYAIPATGVTPATASALQANTRNLCDNFRRQDILPKQERTSFIFSASQDVGERVTLFVDGYYSNREFELTGQGVTAALTVPASNPFFVRPPGTTGAVAVNYDFAPSFGNPAVPGYALSYDFVGGAEVKLWGDWKGEAYASRGRSADAVKRTHNLNTAQAAIALARTDPATALNLFSASPLSASLVNELSNGQFVIKANSNLTVYSAQMDGSLFQAPGGAVRLAVGGEYRKERLESILFSGSTVAPTTVYSEIDRNVKALFGELFIPLVGADNAFPGAQSLAVSLAARYEDYSDFGTTTNPKVGVTWEPVSGVQIRGSYGRSFRAASLGEVDPRSSGYGLYGDTLPGPTGNQFGIGIAGGNGDLKPEKAETWSFGANFKPEFAPGFEADVTYFSIDYKNQILALRGTPGLLTNPFYAPYVVRNPTQAQIATLLASGLPINSPINASQVTFIADGRRQNLGATVVRGFDFNVSYGWTMEDWGDFEAGINAEYFTKYESAAAPGAPTVDVLNTINFPQRFRARANLGWRREAVSATMFVNLIDSYTQNTVSPPRKVNDYATVDLHLAYDLGEGTKTNWLEGTTIALDAQNLFDRDPPFVNLAGGYDSQTINPIGRLVAVSLRKRW